MTENPNVNNETGKQNAEESWQEVGRQFETLGSTLAQAFRTTWNNVETSTDAQQVKQGLESMLRQVGQAVEDAAKTPDAQKVKEETKKAVESLRVAGEQTVEEARPQILNALRKMNEELQKFIERMDSK